MDKVICRGCFSPERMAADLGTFVKYLYNRATPSSHPSVFCPSTTRIPLSFHFFLSQDGNLPFTAVIAIFYHHYLIVKVAINPTVYFPAVNTTSVLVEYIIVLLFSSFLFCGCVIGTNKSYHLPWKTVKNGIVADRVCRK